MLNFNQCLAQLQNCMDPVAKTLSLCLRPGYAETSLLNYIDKLEY